jgi:aspartate kinase
MSKNKITYAKNLTLISLSSLPCDTQVFSTVLNACAAEGINLDMISQTARKGGSLNMSLTLSDDDLGAVLTVLGKLRSENISIKPEVLPGSCKVNYYDPDMVKTPGVAAKLFAALARADVEVMLVTTSDVDISILVPAHWLDDAVAVVEAEFGLKAEEVTF